VSRFEYTLAECFDALQGALGRADALLWDDSGAWPRDDLGDLEKMVCHIGHAVALGIAGVAMELERLATSYQGRTGRPWPDCVCNDARYALGHMTTCPRYGQAPDEVP